VFGRQLGLTALPTLENLQELLEIRRILESGLLPAAIPALDAVTLGEMRRLTDAMREAAERGEPFLDEDERFHALMYKRLGNQTLSGILGAFWQFFKAASREVTTGEHLAHTAAMHAAIVDALESGDADLAVHRLDAHFFDVRDRLRRQHANECGDSTL
jgi:DNA-binding FadR family transcriptional regulator